VDWAVAKFRAAGADSVRTEAYTIPYTWLAGEAEAECVAPEHFPIRLTACPATASTLGGRALEASLVDAGEGTPEAFARLGDKARGAVALVHSDEMKTEEDRIPAGRPLARSGAKSRRCSTASTVHTSSWSALQAPPEPERDFADSGGPRLT
jgi:hypothetical protein